MIPLTNSFAATSDSSVAQSLMSSKASVLRRSASASLTALSDLGSVASLHLNNACNPCIITHSIDASKKIERRRSYSVGDVVELEKFQLEHKSNSLKTLKSIQDAEPRSKRPPKLRDLMQQFRDSYQEKETQFRAKMSAPSSPSQKPILIDEVKLILKQIREYFDKFIAIVCEYLAFAPLLRHYEIIKECNDSRLLLAFSQHHDQELTFIKDQMSAGIRLMDSYLEQWDQLEKSFLIHPVQNYKYEALDPINNQTIDPNILMPVQKLSINIPSHKLEFLDPDAFAFRKIAMNLEYRVYVGMHEQKPMIITHHFQNRFQHCVILRTIEGPDEVINITLPKEITKSRKAIKKIIPDIDIESFKSLAVDKALDRMLKSMDELKAASKYKIGVFYVKAGQTLEAHYLNNEHASPEFVTFLSILGDCVSLSNFQDYAGGLDTLGGKTGSQSYYRHWRNFEIMFHVSTCLPFIPSCEQQIERKRHIGNDVVNIVFLEHDAQFDPGSVKSSFTHIFIVVQKTRNPVIKTLHGYMVSVARHQDVPIFGPSVPSPSVFVRPEELREFLLAKMINGENAAYKAPVFSRLHSKARSTMINSLAEKAETHELEKPKKTTMTASLSQLFSRKKTETLINKKRNNMY